MDYDYESYLLDKLNLIKQDLNLDINIFTAVEQNFARMEELNPNDIFITIKYLSSNIQYYAETMPIQILVLSEENSLDKVRMLFNKFTNDYNWNVITPTGTNLYIKQQYNSPVVLNNYVEVGHGYRSVLYVTATLYIMENVADVKSVTIDGESITPLSFNISYSMSTNTQQLADVYIASSVKTVSTFAITIMIPMINNGLINKVLNILNEFDDTLNNIEYNGNNTFTISFMNGSISITKDMKLTSVQIITAPNQVPSLQLGFMK